MRHAATGAGCQGAALPQRRRGRQPPPSDARGISQQATTAAVVSQPEMEPRCARHAAENVGRMQKEGVTESLGLGLGSDVPWGPTLCSPPSTSVANHHDGRHAHHAEAPPAGRAGRRRDRRSAAAGAERPGLPRRIRWLFRRVPLQLTAFLLQQVGRREPDVRRPRLPGGLQPLLQCVTATSTLSAAY